ncbi:MAG: hypothetical protein E7402_04130 [Ruminococcaceae bacterium]|nr:hypothetical protein [Oscillospiraceae bacterium]
MSLFYKIAGLTIQTEDHFLEADRKHLACYQVEPTEAPDMVFTFHLNCTDITLPEHTLVADVNKRHWCITKDGGYAFYDQIPEISDRIYNAMVTDSAFRNVELWLCPSEVLGLSEDQRPYNLIHEMLCYALLLHQGMVFHGSSIAVNSQGLIFSAPSGTGKSTHTGLWLKHVPGTAMVNDDKPIIRMEADKPFLYGAPWSGKNSIHKNVRVPLAAIIFIERATTCALLPMDPMEAVWQILDAVRKPALPVLAEKNMDLVAKLVENLPIYLLRCDISEDAVRAAKQALRGL